jgi:ketosteroid isomerase-like protein
VTIRGDQSSPRGLAQRLARIQNEAPAGAGCSWAAAWNRRDLDAVLALFADDAVFESPKAVAVTGAARVVGKGALRAYWQAAPANITSLQLDVENVLLDVEARCVVVVYRSLINASALRVAEQLQWGADGRVCSGAAYYGAARAGRRPLKPCRAFECGSRATFEPGVNGRFSAATGEPS